MPGPRFGLEGTASPEEQYQRDLNRAAGFKPITPQDLKTAYSQYDQQPGQVRRNDSDSFLHQKAVTTVIDWWKRQKEAEAAKKVEADRRAASEAAARAKAEADARAAASRQSGSGSAGGSSGGGSGGGSSSGGGFMLPNTSMGATPTAVPNLKPIPRPVTANYVAEQLRRNGLVGAKPPASALLNMETFHRWVNQAVAWMQKNRSVAVKTPTGTKVVTTQPIATARRPVIR